MALPPGTRLGAYEVVAQIGAGGMGEVYRARDTKLNRDVALKILPEGFAIDGDRIARFRREAQVLASLNHPNIAAIYGFEDSGSTHALVLELVEGPTVADRIAKGPIPLDEALPIAKQIAEALEAAHEQGIIHRDLKPANIKLRDDGTVKVLDFGLAKAMEPASAISPALTASPTITTPAMMTGVGMILGTAAYMSPEQAKGRPADKRSDVWGFGCVLYEMLTGKRAFEGEDVSDTLAAVLRGAPDWSSLPSDTPGYIRTLLARSLQKDPQKRLSQIAGASYALADSETAPTASPTQPETLLRARSAGLMFVGLGVILGSAITGVSWWVSRTPSRPNLVTRFTLTLPEGEQITDPQHRTVAISPDGTRIAYVANRQLHLRSMSDSQGVVIASSELERGVGTPVFSPDSRSIAFVLGNTGGGNVIRKIEATGGTPITLTEVRSNNVLGLSWTGDDIVFADAGDGLVRVSSTTHKREVLVAPTRGQIIQGPILLPGGEVVLFALGQPSPGVDTPTADSWDTAKIVALRLRTGERKTLIEGGSDPHYVATGHLLYAVSGAMFAVRFDPKRLEVDGERVPILNGVGRTGIARTSTGMMQFSVSDTGSAIYLAPSSSTAVDPPKLMFVDRAGKAEPLKLPPGLYERPRISPDGTQLTFGSQDATGAKIWIYALSGVSAMRQLTFEGKNQFPIWSADGQHVAFQSDRDGDTAIFWQRSDGSTKAERLTRPDPGTTHVPESWSRDGDHFLYTVEKGGIKALWVFSMTAKKGEPFSAVQSRRLISPEFSPNSRWVAYTLTNPGMNQVFIEPFPATGAKRFLVGVGARPQWSPDGKELFFYNGDRTFVVTVTTDPGFATTEPVALPFNVYGGRGPGFGRDADIMPDGKRFVALVSPSTSSVAGGVGRQFDVVLNWTEELKQRVPSK